MDFYLTISPWFSYLGVLLVSLIGLFLSLVGLPGIWLIPLATILFAWVTGIDTFVGVGPIAAIILLGLAAEIIEFFAGALGAKSAGGAKRSMAGAVLGGIIGGIVGTPVLPIIGTIFGSVIGAFLGAYLLQLTKKASADAARKTGTGAAVGRVIGIITKTSFGVAMMMVALIACFPYPRPTAPASTPAPTQTAPPAPSPDSL
jgi:uncharacterized protein YqgC (DUF456 family)